MSNKTTEYKIGIFMDAERTAHAPQQIDYPATISDLIEALNDLEFVYGGDCPVFFRHDNGHTYGTPSIFCGGIEALGFFQDDYCCDRGMFDPHCPPKTAEDDD